MGKITTTDTEFGLAFHIFAKDEVIKPVHHKTKHTETNLPKGWKIEYTRVHGNVMNTKCYSNKHFSGSGKKLLWTVEQSKMIIKSAREAITFHKQLLKNS